MSRLNWNKRESPTDFDDITPTAVTFEFDHRRSTTPGSNSWPKAFGPSVISNAWKAGLVVVAEIEGYPHPVVVTESRWGANGVLQVKTLEGYKIANRIYTRPSAKGLSVTGELIEK